MKIQETRITIDMLTQINNRTKMMQYLEGKMNSNSKYPLCCIMLDVNHFKEINDTYGHLEGDYALMSIAKVLKASCSCFPCLLARFGGDEFFVVC